MIKKILKKILQIYKSSNEKKKDRILKKILGENKIIVLDIGAAGGLEGLQEVWKPHIKNLNLIMSEPHENSRKEIKNKEYQIINEGFGSNCSSDSIFFETRKSECSSTKELNIDYLKRFPNPERFELLKKNTIKLTTLDTVFSEENFPHFIKIDTEGGELDILKGGPKTLSNIFGIVVESYFSEIHKNQSMFEEIKNLLEEKKFEFIDFLRLVRWERHNLTRDYGQIQVADSLFLLAPEEVLKRFKQDLIDINSLKIYVAILFILNRPDYINVIMRNIDAKTNSEIFIKECYYYAEKCVKRMSNIKKFTKTLERYF